MRDNERAAAAEAVNTVRTKLVAFGLSAFMAGVAGGLFAYLYGHLSFDSFAPLASVTFATTAYIGGIGSIAGAVIAGIISSGGPVFELFSSSASVDRYQALIAGAGRGADRGSQPGWRGTRVQQELQGAHGPVASR